MHICGAKRLHRTCDLLPTQPYHQYHTDLIVDATDTVLQLWFAHRRFSHASCCFSHLPSPPRPTGIAWKSRAMWIRFTTSSGIPRTMGSYEVVFSLETSNATTLLMPPIVKLGKRQTPRPTPPPAAPTPPAPTPPAPTPPAPSPINVNLPHVFEPSPFTRFPGDTPQPITGPIVTAPLPPPPPPPPVDSPQPTIQTMPAPLPPPPRPPPVDSPQPTIQTIPAPLPPPPAPPPADPTPPPPAPTPADPTPPPPTPPPADPTPPPPAPTPADPTPPRPAPAPANPTPDGKPSSNPSPPAPAPSSKSCPRCLHLCERGG